MFALDADPDRVQVLIDVLSMAFFDAGLKGIVFEDGVRVGDDPFEEGYQDVALCSVAGYFPSISTLDSSLRAIEGKIAEISESFSIEIQIESRTVDEEDWAQSWKEYFFPVEVTSKLVVKPTWREYAQKPGQIIVEIDPGMAFGTGTHATTNLCIKLIDKHLKKGWKYLDVGCGSGILMAFASKLGASFVRGIEIDENAVNIARKNQLLNKVEESMGQVFQGDLLEKFEFQHEIVTANVLFQPVMRMLDSVSRVLVPGGLLITSGFSVRESASVAEKMEQNGFTIIEIPESEEWAAVCGKITG